MKSRNAPPAAATAMVAAGVVNIPHASTKIASAELPTKKSVFQPPGYESRRDLGLRTIRTRHERALKSRLLVAKAANPSQLGKVANAKIVGLNARGAIL
jgi:hypothetical protein